MFVKHIIKTLHVSVTTVCPSSGGRFPCLVLLLLFCLFASSSCLFGMWLYVVYVCACLMYLSVGCLVVNQSCCVRGRAAGRPARPQTQHDCHHDTKVKPEAATPVIELLMMGRKTPEIPVIELLMMGGKTPEKR
jgi:hypothetical protein